MAHFCFHCGTPIQQNASYCSQCRAPVPQSQQNFQHSQPTGGAVTSVLLELMVYPVIYYLWRGREIKQLSSAERE